MRTVLLDTHMALWMMTDSPRLPGAVREAAGAPDVEWVFHQTSTWEIQIKHALGKLELPKPPAEFLSAAISETGFAYRTIEDQAIFMLAKLPDLHRDPFDRLLVAHAAVHGWELATVDPQVASYPIRVFS